MPVGDVHGGGGGGGGGRLSERCGSRNELSSYNSMSLRRDGRSKKCNTTAQKVATILRSRSCRDREILCKFSASPRGCWPSYQLHFIRQTSVLSVPTAALWKCFKHAVLFVLFERLVSGTFLRILITRNSRSNRTVENL